MTDIRPFNFFPLPAEEHADDPVRADFDIRSHKAEINKEEKKEGKYWDEKNSALANWGFRESAARTHPTAQAAKTTKA